MSSERSVARTALALSVAALLLGPAAGFAAGYAFAEAGPAGPAGPPGPEGPPGPAGESGPDIGGGIILTDTICPGDTARTERSYIVMWEGMNDEAPDDVAGPPPALVGCRIPFSAP